MGNKTYRPPGVIPSWMFWRKYENSVTLSLSRDCCEICFEYGVKEGVHFWRVDWSCHWHESIPRSVRHDIRDSENWLNSVTYEEGQCYVAHVCAKEVWM